MQQSLSVVLEKNTRLTGAFTTEPYEVPSDSGTAAPLLPDDQKRGLTVGLVEVEHGPSHASLEAHLP